MFLLECFALCHFVCLSGLYGDNGILPAKLVLEQGRSSLHIV